MSGEQVIAEDREIWRKFRSGDKQAYAFIYQTYFRKLYNYGRKFSTDSDLLKDCVQDLFTKLWKNKEYIGDTTSIKNYLFASFRRILIEKIKRQRQTLLYEELPDTYNFEINFPVETQLIGDQTTLERKEELLRALHTLTGRQREAIFLKFYEELSYDQIATVMAISTKATYKIVAKAIASLKENVKKIYIIFLITLFL